MPSVRGIQMVVPNERVTRSAMLVLPLPGLPNRNMPRPELMAGPSRSSIRGGTIKSAKARFESSSVACCLAIV